MQLQEVRGSGSHNFAGSNWAEMNMWDFPADCGKVAYKICLCPFQIEGDVVFWRETKGSKCHSEQQPLQVGGCVRVGEKIF